jgi:PAS domain S-box-containing protein
LHVDDDLCFLDVSKQILLNENNFEIDNVISVAEAFKKMEEQSYDAIISDYEMPLKNGLDFLKEVREKNNQIPFILFTGRGREDVAVKALNLGADSYLNKNGSPETVYCELAHAINKSVEAKKAGEILKESEQKYRELANCLPNIVFEADLCGQLEFANERAAEISGYSLKDIEKGLNILQFVAPEDRENALKNIQRVLSGGNYSPKEYNFLRKDGTIFPALITANPRINKDRITGFRGLVLDITERKKAEEVVRKSEQRYRELANFLPEIVFEADLTGKIIFFSQQACEVTGFKPEEIEKGMNLISFVALDERKRADENIKKVFSGESPNGHEYTLSRKNGTTFPAIVKTATIISENKVVGLRGIVTDISESKKLELELRQKYEILERAGESIGAGLAIIGKDYSILWANKTLRKSFAETNKKCHQIFNKSDSVCSECGVKKVFEQNSSMDIHEFKTENSQGETVWIELRVTPLRDNEGKITAALELAVPITERKKTEEELRNSLERERFLGNLITSSSLAIAVAFPDGKLMMGNEAFQKLTGYNEEELKTITWNKILTPPKWHEHEIQKLKEINQTKKAGTYRKEYVHKDGTIIPVELVVHPSFDEKQNVAYYVGFVTDITERKKAEDELRESQHLNNKILCATPNLIYIYDLIENCNTYSNKEVFAFLGYTPEQIKSMGSNLFANLLHPDDAERVAKHHAHFASAPYNVTYEIDYRMKHSNGEWRWFRSCDTLFSRTQTGFSKQILGITEDITDRKKAEEEIRNEKRNIEIINEKLQVVGGLTRHDVRNKLMAMKANAYLIKKEIGNDSKLLKYLEGINSAIEETKKIIEFSQLYEKIGSEKLVNINVKECFDEAISLFSDRVDVKVTNECQGLIVTADSLLRQVLYNLVDNSLKHGEKVAQIRLHYKKDKNGIKLIYEDNGVGIPKRQKTILFSKGLKSNNGSGLGLKFIKKIMEVYGWNITEKGQPNKGAKFVLEIPKIKMTTKEMPNREKILKGSRVD